MDDKLLDEFIDRLMEYVEINESRPPAEYVRTYLHPILAAERERVKKECQEICDEILKYLDLGAGEYPPGQRVEQIKRRISELKP